MPARPPEDVAGRVAGGYYLLFGSVKKYFGLSHA